MLVLFISDGQTNIVLKIDTFRITQYCFVLEKERNEKERKRSRINMRYAAIEI